MADIVKLRTGYAVKVSVLRVGFAGPPGAGGGSAYDDTAILARVSGVEQSIAALPAPYDDAALVGRVSALEGASVAWADITGKPADFPPTAHRHDASQIDNLPPFTWANIVDVPTAFPPTSHRHDASQIDNLPAPTWTDITGKPSAFPPVTHNHEISAVTGLQSELDGKQPLTTFKTINGEVITGSGDIIVSGGAAAGASQVFPELSGKVAGIAIPYNQLSAGGAAWFTDLGARGIPVVRLDAYWDNIQTTKGGAYNWTALDAVVDGLRANGVHVLLVPNNKPAWASSALTDATDRQACADFCGALAAHYVGRCDNFEIVNEPNKTAITAATYADLLKRAYVAIKKANPLAAVISGGLAPTMTNGANMTRLQEWVDAFFDVPNIGAYFDQFGMHPYTLPYWLSDPEVANSTVENGWSWMVNLIRPRMVAEGLASKPVAITEMGFVSDSDQAFDGAQGQAEAVQEAITASLALPWVSSFFLYSYRDIGGATTNPEHWFGMIDPTGADKPVAAVFQTAAQGGYAGAVGSSVTHTHEISDVTGLQAELDGKSPTGHSHPWSDLTGVPTEFVPSAHQHAIGDVSGLQAALDGKAPASSIWTQEQLQDLVAAMFQTGTHSNASITYDDASGSLSITASGGGASLTEEEVEDFVGGLIVQGTGISVAYDDAGNVLSISLAGESYTTAEKNKLAGIAPGATANATDAQLRDRSTHTGTQAITTISGLQTALDGKAPTNHSHTISNVTGLQTALDGKAPTNHSHTISNVTGLQTALDAKLDDSQATPTGLAVLGAVNQAAARDALGAPREQIDVFDTAGTFTWQKPAWATRFAVHLIGSGGGGGGGASGNNTAVRAGGGGGGAGMVSRWEFLGTEYTATCTIVVGAGGAGGASTMNASGAVGGHGANSEFRLNGSSVSALALVAGGGIRGGGGGTTGTAGAGGATGTFGGTSNPGGAGGTTGAGAAGSSANLSVAGGGGGGGGGKSTAGVVGAGGGGSIGFAVGGGRAVAGTAGGASSGGAGVNGADPSYVLGAGAGGGGGGSSTTTVGGKGGNGGAGAGGGGGGSAMDTFLAGSGGRGGDGRAVIISYEV